MGRLKINGADIAYDAVGKGEPIVLVHGLASNRVANWVNTGWYRFFENKQRQVVALDLRGHGESQKFYGADDYTPEVLGEDIIGLMDHLNVARSDIMGYSMGAWLAAYLMATHPNRFKSGILGGIGGEVLALTTRAERIAQALTTRSPESISDRFLKTLRQFAESMGNDLRALAACNRGVYSKGAPLLEKILQPVLIVGGMNDDFAGSPKKFMDKIPNATVHMLPDRDHVSLLTAKLFKDRVSDFIGKTPP